jgi:hypothetical protein
LKGEARVCDVTEAGSAGFWSAVRGIPAPAGGVGRARGKSVFMRDRLRHAVWPVGCPSVYWRAGYRRGWALGAGGAVCGPGLGAVFGRAPGSGRRQGYRACG